MSITFCPSCREVQKSTGGWIEVSRMETDMQMLRACMKYHNRTQEDVSRALGMVRSTFYLHMKDGDFTISQIHKMMEYIPLTMDDVNRIFFAIKK